MSILTDKQAQLVKVNTAIDIILTGSQEYKLNDMQVETWVKKANLENLYILQSRLEMQINSLSGNGGFYAN